MKIGSCNVKIDKQNDISKYVIVAFDGYVEKGDNSDEIKECILQLGREGYIDLIVDCSALRFHLDIDITFFPVLNATFKKEYGGIVVFINLPNNLLSTIEIMQMNEWTPNFKTIDGAVQFLNAKRKLK